MTAKVAKDAFTQHNYLLACEFYENCLSEKKRSSDKGEISHLSFFKTNLDVYYGYGDTLAKLGRLKESFDVYAHICNHLYGIVPLEKLKCLVLSLVDSLKALVSWSSNNNASIFINTLDQNYSDNEHKDQLLCPVCEDILKYPVTSICGHSFCRQCCFGRTQCSVCGERFINIASFSPHSLSSIYGHSYNCANASNNSYSCISFEQDVLIRRLVEKWWGPQLRASELNDEAQRCLENELLDEALKSCNQSLELGK